MDDIESNNSRPKRPMILDVSSERSTHNKNFKRKNNKKKSNKKNQISNPVNEKQEMCEPIPLELKKVIDAATMYGKQTYALGAHRGVATLNKIALILKEIANDPTSRVTQGNKLFELIELAESESKQLVVLFCSAYNDE